jgi:hypothetical protein
MQWSRQCFCAHSAGFDQAFRRNPITSHARYGIEDEEGAGADAAAGREVAANCAGVGGETTVGAGVALVVDVAATAVDDGPIRTGARPTTTTDTKATRTMVTTALRTKSCAICMSQDGSTFQMPGKPAVAEAPPAAVPAPAERRIDKLPASLVPFVLEMLVAGLIAALVLAAAR